MDLTQQLIYLTHSKETFSTTRTALNFNKEMCLFIEAGRGSRGPPPSVFNSFHICKRCTSRRGSEKNPSSQFSETDMRHREILLHIDQILHHHPPAHATFVLLTQYTPNKTC